jgi:nitronate monooxygenase
MRTAAARQGDADRLSLWAGQAAPLARAMPAADLVALLVKESSNVATSLTV